MAVECNVPPINQIMRKLTGARYVFFSIYFSLIDGMEKIQRTDIDPN